MIIASFSGTNVESISEDTSKKGAEGFVTVPCIYRQGLGIFPQNDTVALKMCDNP